MSSYPLPSNPNPNRSPPPPPRSRSPIPPPRSHNFSRSGFAPLPPRHSERDFGGPGSGYGGDDIPPPRDWDRRDREREEWDRGERERRAPLPGRWEDDYDRKRRRSPSPPYPSNRTRRRSPSPTRPHLPDPAELDYCLTFRQFSEWFRASHPQTARADDEESKRLREGGEHVGGPGKERVGMSKRYERYRKEYSSRQLYALYLQHRESPWFLERYSPEEAFASQRKRVNRQGRVPTAERYLDALKAGTHDNVSFDYIEDGGKGGNGEKTDALDRALEDREADEPMRMEVAPSKRQVFIKTVPPSTGRKELEKVFHQIDGFEYLALTEPSSKKAFHRVGWAQFGEGVNVLDVVKKLDGFKIETFTFHLGVNATPVIGRIRLTPPLSNAPERIYRDAEKARELCVKLEAELIEDDQDEEVAEQQGEGENKEKTKEGEKEKKVAGLREKGVDVIEERIERILEGMGLGGTDLGENEKFAKAKITLDHYLSYLRHGLSTCYYCVAPLAFPEELQRKCIAHMRSPAPSGIVGGDSALEPGVGGDEDDEDRRERDRDDGPAVGGGVGGKAEKEGGRGGKSADEKWEENLEGKLKPLLSEVDVVEYGGRDIEEETKKLAAPLIKQEEESKYRCKECSKLFKAPEFVMKHVVVKHGEGIKARLDELTALNNFVLDPQHLQTTQTTIPAVNDKLPIPQPLPMPNLPIPSFNPSAFPQSFAGNGSGGNNASTQQMQMMMMMQMQQAMLMNMGGMGGMGVGGGGGGSGGGGNGGLQGRIGGYADHDAPEKGTGTGREDPRAKKGRVSYRDLDEDGGGLPY